MRKLIGTASALLLAIACAESEPKIVPRPEALAVDRDEISFGAIFVGSHYLKRVEVQNLGTDASVSIGVADVPLGFTVSPAAFTLAPMAKTFVEVRFFPVETRPYEGTIEFRAGSTAVEVRVDGLGVPRAIDVEMHLSFGDVKVGEEATLPLTLVSLTDAPLEVAIRNASDRSFTVDRVSLDLAPRGTETILITFAPTSRGGASKTFHLDLCQGCAGTYVEVDGNGVGKELRASPDPVGFDDVALGLIRRQQVTITNVGDFDVAFGSIEAQGDGFAADLEGFPERLAVGESAPVELSFTAPEEGFHTGVFLVDDEDGTRLLGIRLFGSTGGPFLEVTPAALEFGRRVVGMGSAPAQLRIENVLELALIDLVEARIEGADADAFQLDFNGPSAIEPRVDLTVSFDPGRAGELEAELVLRTTFVEQAELRVPLSGSAVAPIACTLRVPEKVRFGAVAASATKRQDLVVVNDGTEPCPLWGFEVAGHDAGAFSFGLPAKDPMVLEAGASLSVPVLVRSGAPMNRLLDASFRFTHSDLEATPTSVPVSAWIVEQIGVTVDRMVLDFEATPIDRATVGELNLTRPAGGTAFPHIALQSDSFRLFPGQAIDVRNFLKVEIVFEPKAEGHHAGELEIRLGTIPEPVIVRLGGEGVAACGDGACEWPTVACEASIDPNQWNRLRITSTIPDITRCGWVQGVSDWPASVQPDWSPCEATLLAPVSGSYSADLVAARADGRADLCTASAQVDPPGYDLWIEVLSTQVMAQGIALLHGAGGDPHLKPSWSDPASSCTFQGFRQTPPRCEWDEEGFHDDPFGSIVLGNWIFMQIAQPTVAAPYFLGLLGAPLQPGSTMTTRIHCGGALAVERTIALSQPHDFRILGALQFRPDGSCEFADDGLGWSSHRTCLEGDPHCP